MTTKPGPNDLRAIADRYGQAWSAHDVETIVAMHTPDSRFHSHGREQAVRGREALRTEFAAIAAAMEVAS